MNKQLKVLMLLLGIALLVAGPVAAKSSSEIDSYMQNLKHRIDRGERSGQLTSKEAARLNGRYKFIAVARDRAESDGRLSRDERARLMDSLTKLDQAIWNNLHDDEVAHWRDWDSHSGDWRARPTWEQSDYWQGESHHDDSQRGNSHHGDSRHDDSVASRSEIDSYMQNLKHRIDRGERSGQLTSKEAYRLNGMYNFIATARDRAERDGRLSRDERARLMDSLAKLDQAIWTNLHDDEVAHWRDWDSKSGDWRHSPTWEQSNYWQADSHHGDSRYGDSHRGDSRHDDSVASKSEIDSYMRNLKHRIDKGERSGQLTSKEAARLNGRYNLIATARDRAERDGRLSRDDRTRLMDSLTRLDQAIWDNLHDDEASHWRAWDSKSGDWRQKPNWRD